MKPLRPVTIALLTAGVCFSAGADDGQQVLKRMTGGSIDNQLTVLPEDIDHHVSDAEHAFTDMMRFYVPMQSASGATGDDLTNDAGDYYNVDDELVESLTVAKPLVNVFIYGPTIGVPHTAFAHSFMDTFAAVSLDDGVTWKTTNLSQTADQSSFELGQGSAGGGGSDDDDDGHHGAAPTFEFESATWSLDGETKILTLTGTTEDESIEGIAVSNYTTGEALFTGDATVADGTFTLVGELGLANPCMVLADVDGDYSTPLAVVYPEGNSCDAGVDLTDYPGGTYNVFQATAGNKTLVAWPSRFCQQGQPAYSFAWDGDDEGLSEDQLAKRTALVSLFNETSSFSLSEDLYLTDLFGVAGSQRSINFADEGYPQAGEVPFGCVWTARGVLLPGDDPRTDNVEESYMVWTKPERLTSGRRDPNRIELAGVAGAGFVITWQEDPDGLRPGQGEGPGEGWSGAVAHDKTDVWYSFIPWAYFDLVENPDAPAGAPVNAADHDLLLTGRPQVYVPMAVPMRLTNNDKCQADFYGPEGTVDATDPKYFSYCNYAVAGAYGLQNFCAATVDIPQGPQGELKPICVNEDGLPNVANTGSTRARTSLQGYDIDGDGKADSAWVIVAAEESKGLGRYTFLPDGTACVEVRPDEDGYNPDCGADIGKNQWYFSFDMGAVDSSATSGHENGLVQNLVSQGNLLNQPEVDWRTGEFYPVINTAAMWDFGAYNFDLYNTEIARRSSILVQSIGKAKNSTSGLLSVMSYKQGAMRQGGPADTMLRRFTLPLDSNCTLPEPPGEEQFAVCHVLKTGKEKTLFVDTEEDGYADHLADHEDDYAGICRSELCFDIVESIDTNPYAFTNMVCEDDNWLVLPGENPYYPDGVCGAPATNLSSVVPDECVDDSGEVDDQPCPTVDFSSGTTFGIGDTNPILQGYIQGEGNTTRVVSWHQCPGAGGSDGTALDTSELTGEGYAYVDCDTDLRTDDYVNLKDQSWYNPLDVSKGHRGFLDGDFVMFLYAWSPNWRLNAKGNDRYELYVRRSFDGGETWRTTPSSFTAANLETYSGEGTVTCETYRSSVTQAQGDALEPHVCFAYEAGANEQARNVTQHSRMRITTLDPRYAPTPGSITDGCIDALGLPDTVVSDAWVCDDGSDVQDTDLRNPSRYFMVYETGDNSTVADGEAEPEDLFYSRAERFGDEYAVWTETDTGYDGTYSDTCYPSDPKDDDKVVETVVEGSGFCNEFDRMNAGGDTHSSEANLEANPDGSKMYGVWAQWVFDDDGEEVVESDAMARRIWWIDDYRSEDDALIYTLPGTSENSGTGQD